MPKSKETKITDATMRMSYRSLVAIYDHFGNYRRHSAMYWIRRSTGATLFVPGNWLWVIALIQNGARAALASLAQCCEWLILSAFGASRFFQPSIDH